MTTLHDEPECYCAECEYERSQNKPTEVSLAMEVLKKAFAKDPDFAYTWHCNIAMMCYDAIRDSNIPDIKHLNVHAIGNDAASRFMKLAFDVETNNDMMR